MRCCGRPWCSTALLPDGGVGKSHVFAPTTRRRQSQIVALYLREAYRLRELGRIARGTGIMTRGISSVVHRQAIEPQQAFRQAMAFQQQGLLREAERLYEIVLKADERHLAALYHLGLVRLQQGR